MSAFIFHCSTSIIFSLAILPISLNSKAFQTKRQFFECVQIISMRWMVRFCRNIRRSAVTALINTKIHHCPWELCERVRLGIPEESSRRFERWRAGMSFNIFPSFLKFYYRKSTVKIMYDSYFFNCDKVLVTTEKKFFSVFRCWSGQLQLFIFIERCQNYLSIKLFHNDEFVIPQMDSEMMDKSINADQTVITIHH